VKKKLKILALFDAIAPTTIDQDLSAELKTEDWKTEANVLKALGELGHTAEHLAIFDDLDLLRQKLLSFGLTSSSTSLTSSRTIAPSTGTSCHSSKCRGCRSPAAGPPALPFASTRAFPRRSSVTTASTHRTL